jgi:peptide/nickel transport system ATP-binding protein
MDCATCSTRVTTEASPVLAIEDLGVTFATPAGDVEAVSGFSLSVQAGECVGIVGESGAGKSQAFLAVMGLLPPNARTRGSARFGTTELLGREGGELDQVRGAGVSMIFQDPLTSLTPHLMIGDQIAESLVRHTGVRWVEARARALALLEQVHVTDPKRRLKQYPHELSGGMRQRVMIAIALACDPKLLIADEPTTALDVTIQAQILALLAELKRERGMGMVLITHDLGIVAGVADRVAVMQAGQIVELGAVGKILKRPEHAYTQALLRAVPRLDSVLPPASSPALPPTTHASTDTTLQAARAAADQRSAPSVAAGDATSHGTLLHLAGLRVDFHLRNWLRRGATIRAVDEVELEVHPGEAIGIVGESGSGKSTLARAVLRLLRPVSGQIVWLGQPIEAASSSELAPLRRDTQLVFQDPLASLDPRMRVSEIVAEPLRVHRPDLDAKARTATVAEMLLRVGLGRNLLARYPHELSGGQAQRVAIARAMILKPKLLVCDEAVSALDVSVQAQILTLLQDLKREYSTSILFISHNLAVVRQLCERVLVLYLGRMMEQGTTATLYSTPAHPYTRGLLDAVPIPDPDLQPARLAQPLQGELPSPIAPPRGCVFHTRCPHAADICRQSVPAWEVVAPGHQVACHRWREIPT